MIDYIRHCSKKELLLCYLAACTAILLVMIAWSAWRRELRPFIRNHDRKSLAVVILSFYGLPLVGFELFMQRILAVGPEEERRSR